MSGIKVDAPPLSGPIVDSSGLPTREFLDYMSQMWARSGGDDDNTDFLIKLMTGARYPNPPPPRGQDWVYQPPAPGTIGEALEAAENAKVLAMAMKRTSVDPDQLKRESIPVGGIIMWSGAHDALPVGWALCDGTSGTPDLRDRFVVGAGNTYAAGDTGGAATASVTSEETALTTTKTQVAASTAGTDPEVISAIDPHTHAVNDIPTMPPYYALAFIMKT